MVEPIRKRRNDTHELNEVSNEQKKDEIYYTYVETILPSGKKAGDKVLAGRQSVSPPQRSDPKDG